jgi:hypothetical protein
MPISLVAGTKKHPLAERGADLYQTPVPAVHALLRVERIPDKIWEPAAGPGAIVKALRATGRTVVATDLHDWGCPASLAGADFLRQDRAPDGVEAIVTNPPYSLAGQFVRHAKALCPEVIMLMRLGFLESTGRSDILDDGTLAAVYVFANRLQMMHRHGWEGNKASSAMCFAWMVWRRDHKGPATIQRIRWEAEPNQT